MGFQEAVSTCMSKYFTFSGRARRAEFWWFYLFTFILSIFGELIDLALGVSFLETGIFAILLTVVFVVPTLSAGARRLHDVNLSGWWQISPFIPLIAMPLVSIPGLGGVEGLMAAVVLVAAIVLLIFLVRRGTTGTNRFGEDPIGGSIEEVF